MGVGTHLYTEFDVAIALASLLQAIVSQNLSLSIKTIVKRRLISMGVEHPQKF